MPIPEKHPVIIIFGVSGCGKTTIGKLLSEKLSVPFYDADDFHPQTNVEKMRQGIALTDKDRLPWLKALAYEIGIWTAHKGAVLACSALKESYRKLLASQAKKLHWVLLSGPFELIKARMEARKAHFMSVSLLESQFNTLEIPGYGLKAGIDAAPAEIANNIIKKLNI